MDLALMVRYLIWETVYMDETWWQGAAEAAPRQMILPCTTILSHWKDTARGALILALRNLHQNIGSCSDLVRRIFLEYREAVQDMGGIARFAAHIQTSYHSSETLA